MHAAFCRILFLPVLKRQVFFKFLPSFIIIYPAKPDSIDIGNPQQSVLNKNPEEEFKVEVSDKSSEQR